MNDTSAKKDVQKLQRTVVDALEDVKAQDLQVFDTEHLSSLFERVIVASGTSNRQTKALASSVRDKVREGGFGKPRIEGEDNGEWIIVDCGPVVVHIMQPTIRSYYNLEEIWGEKPVRLKFGAPKPVKAAEPKEEAPAKKSAGKKPAAKKAAADKKPAAKSAKPASRSASAGSAKAAPAKTSAAKKPAAPAKLPIVKVALKGAKSSAKSAARAATTAGKPAAKTAAKRPAAKKTTARKA
jgi:ribosome-associated protein